MRAWTLQEIRIVKAYAELGSKTIAEILDRTPKSVRHIAELNGISIKDTGNDVPIQADVLGMSIVEQITNTPGLSICPMCGKRFARMKSGMCRCCHLDQLLELHQEKLDEQIRIRKLDKARQDKRRLRVCDRCGRPFFPRPSSNDLTCQECS